MREIEKTGRTADEAVNLALAELGVSRDQVNVEIVSESQKSRLFGLASHPEVVVRVTVVAEGIEAQDILPPQSELPVEQPEVQGHGAAVARELLEEVLRKMGMSASVQITGRDADGLHASITVDDAGTLIGKHGQTLHALQYLVNTILNHAAYSREGGGPSEQAAFRVLLDAAGYRERRLQSLQRMARHAAEKAKQRGRRVRLDPMPSYERRLIHLTLADDPHVKTSSAGEEPHRQVVIEPTSISGIRDRMPVGGRGRPVSRVSDRQTRGTFSGRRRNPNRQPLDSHFFDQMFDPNRPPKTDR